MTFLHDGCPGAFLLLKRNVSVNGMDLQQSLRSMNVQVDAAIHSTIVHGAVLSRIASAATTNQPKPRRYGLGT